ncbi:MAG: hypothetical protein LBQ50_03185, partial [Planctomycetaceae bacterium]|nr:hypothetical protein [Planctomycetaceae bacterium]
SNTANRISLALSFWKKGSVQIDPYHQFSIDLCFRDGHYYCDKSPGVSFLALPFVGAAYTVLQAAGRTDNLDKFDPVFSSDEFPEPNVNFKFLLIAGTLVVSLIGAIAVVVMYQLMLLFGSTQRVAILFALLLGFGTPLGVWATTMFGHAPAASFLLFGVTLGFYLTEFGCKNYFVKTLLWIVTGIILAYSVWIEYTAAVPACFLGLSFIAMMTAKGYSLRQISFEVTMMCCGAVPIACCFFVYNTIAFGSPFQLGYRFSVGFPEMEDGLYGIKLPDLHVLFLTLFSFQHGILWFSPVLFLSPFYAVLNIKQGRYRILNLVCLFILIYYFSINSAYAYWAQTYLSCRHVTAAMPFLIIPIGLAWSHLGKNLRTITGILMVISFVACFSAMNVPASSEFMNAKNKIAFVLLQFVTGNVRNLPYYLGLNTYLAIGILLFVWLVTGRLLWKYSQPLTK